MPLSAALDQFQNRRFSLLLHQEHLREFAASPLFAGLLGTEIRSGVEHLVLTDEGRRCVLAPPYGEMMRHDWCVEPEHLDICRKEHAALWQRLIRLNINVHTLDSILDYGFDEIFPNDGLTFFTTVVFNTMDSVVLEIHSLLNDEEPYNLNLRQFSNRLGGVWLRPEYRIVYKELKKAHKARMVLHNEKLKTLKSGRTCADILDRIRNYRHTRVAHKTPLVLGQLPEPMLLSRANIKGIIVMIHDLWQLVSLDIEHRTKVLGYAKGVDNDLVRVLDAYARTSRLVTAPERFGDRWTRQRENRRPEKMDTMNRWRKKFGLPPG